MHYYQFNIADYRKDTVHLIPIEHYIYRTLIDWYYLDEQEIPKKTQMVLRRLQLRTEHEENLNNVLNDFFVETENGWKHKRIEQEIKEYTGKCEKNRSNGKLGGRPKKTQSVLNANQNKSEQNPNHKPITNNHKPVIKEKINKKESSDFEAFWQAYPKKVGKQDVLKIWKRIKPPTKKILDALSWQTKSKQWIDGYIPNPATYINQGRWEDEPQQETFKPQAKGPQEKFDLSAYNKQQTELAHKRLFGDLTNEEKDITDEARAL